ncbi:MAG: hypothetical protein U0736_15660 [Gemmataceae bacterium]
MRRLVEFADTDMAGILHFANYFRYLEAAEHAYLRACGLSVVLQHEGETISFPRVGVVRVFEAGPVSGHARHRGASSTWAKLDPLCVHGVAATSAGRARFTVVLAACCRAMAWRNRHSDLRADPVANATAGRRFWSVLHVPRGSVPS